MTSIRHVQNLCRLNADAIAGLLELNGVIDPKAQPALVTVVDELRQIAAADLSVDAPRLLCAACIHDARMAESLGREVPEILPAATVGGGHALCDVRHRIATPAQVAAAQASGLLIPQNGHLPPGFPQS